MGGPVAQFAMQVVLGDREPARDHGARHRQALADLGIELLVADDLPIPGSDRPGSWFAQKSIDYSQRVQTPSPSTFHPAVRCL